MCPGPRSASLDAVTAKTSPRWRQAVVWLHVVSSVAWMSQALALLVLLVSGSPSAADRLDSTLLAPMANVSAFTGLLLAGATAWGYFRHWWVLTKFVLTFVQLYAGIFLLSAALRESAATGVVPWLQPVGTALMASALAFQAWLSVAKPGKKTPWSPAAKPPTAPAWVFVAGIGAPIVDVAAGLALGYPLPAVELVMLIALLGFERRGRRRRAQLPSGRSPRSAPAASRPTA
jgi:hypothetical protein